MADYDIPFIEIAQHNKTILLTRMPASLLTRISYASVRGVDEEEGAVQRFLNPRRIASIKEFTLNGGDYPNAIVLNWVSHENPIVRLDGMIRVADLHRSAQLIDGQHRVAGLAAAVEENVAYATFEVPVVIYEHLNTQECANIFLSINTEQKPAPRSLVFDLYGVADQQIVDPAASRARDIALAMNDDETSPYRGLIKMPGSPRMKGGIALSTAVTAIKPLVEEKGDLEQIGVGGLEEQQRVLLNFFRMLSTKYGPIWSDKSNAFLYASGFVGAVEFFRTKLLPYCYSRKSLTTETMSEVMQIGQPNLILQEEVKGKGGKDAPKLITQRLVDMFNPVLDDAKIQL